MLLNEGFDLRSCLPQILKAGVGTAENQSRIVQICVESKSLPRIAYHRVRVVLGEFEFGEKNVCLKKCLIILDARQQLRFGTGHVSGLQVCEAEKISAER